MIVDRVFVKKKKKKKKDCMTRGEHVQELE